MNNKERFFTMIYHDDRGSIYTLQQLNPKKKPEFVSAEDLLNIKIKDADSYISLNGFRIKSRKTEYCRQINALFFDLDCHDEDVSVEEWDFGHALHVLRDAVEEKRLKKPNIIVNSGRGIHLYYIFKKSIPYYLGDKSLNSIGLKIRESIIAGISNDLTEILAEAGSVFKVDKNTSDISRLVRIPGTLNTSAEKYAKIIDFDEDYYTFADLLQPLKKKKQTVTNTEKPKYQTTSIKNDYGQALHKIRIEELEKLQKYRDFDCQGCREMMCFFYYNAAVNIYEPKKAFENLKKFRNKFNDKRAVPDSQLKALAKTIDNKMTRQNEVYKLTKDRIIKALAITPDEITELRLFQLSKRELKKQKNKIDKQQQAMQVIELAANGMNHQTIADTVGISKRKVQYILKAAGVTRGYNHKSA